MARGLLQGRLQWRAMMRRRGRATSGIRPAVGHHAVGLRVLVIDDNADAAEIFAEVLRDAGCIVEVAFDGVEALASAARTPPDVALIDIGLPGMDGYELARRLRSACPSHPLRLVALTGFGEDLQRSRAAGFDLYLTKPIDVDGLERAIARRSTWPRSTGRCG